jgi:acyl transferase domain-containing protein/NAD(P)-dependent dehydrogenase (short-subunit alcohol dehydrogenase family)
VIVTGEPKMQDTADRAIAIVGVGAIMPDAPNAAAFWDNIKAGRYSISEVTPDRWDPAVYYDPDHNAPDKTYSKIGGWVREAVWEPLKWRLAIPPKVIEGMDHAQRWAIACTRDALADYGYPDRPLATERTAVILGNAMGGEKHYLTVMRAHFPEYARELDETASFAALPAALRRDIAREWRARIGDRLPPITEDTMPGELSNCLAGRIANVFNFHGPNYVCDAACASAMAAIHAVAEGLIAHDFDVAITGGVDRNMGASSFIKFCKIGALSGSGSRPYAEGADGFVMGEGGAIFLMKRLADAERAGDKIYAVMRGVGGSSDGKGKGITAPNPIGQKISIERAWENAGLSPETATLIEGHGTSTSVGDSVEVQSMAEVLKKHGANGHPIALGSVKSNIGHLKSGAGAAGILKATFALRDKVLPPSARCEHPNPNIDWAHTPLYVNRELRPWTETVDGVRRAGVSAFGFGGTNFHIVLEEYIPHRLTGNGKHSVAKVPMPSDTNPVSGHAAKAPLRGALVVGAASESELAGRLRATEASAKAGHTPPPLAPREADLHAPERIAIDYGNAAELADKCAKALKAIESHQPAVWKALRAQGIFRGQGPAAKVAFLYTGQGSQYPNMLRNLRDAEPIVAATFKEADGIMTPILGKPLSDYIFVDPANSAAIAQAEEDLRQTAITQPAVLATDLALTRLLDAYGIRPDMTMGHSLGEYGALGAAGALPFADALEAVAARGREMTRVSMADKGRMAAVFAPLAEIERILKSIDGYVVIANLNSQKQAVIGGASRPVELAVEAFLQAGYNAVPLPVSLAFHTSIVEAASVPLREVLDRLRLQPAKLPIVANVDGEFYPMGPDVRPAMLDILTRQVFSPVQFIKGLHTLYQAGARVFVEVGPKKALHGFAEDVLGEHSEVLALFTNHPKFEDAVAFNQALCGLYSAGLGTGRVETQPDAVPVRMEQRPIARPVVITGASLGLPGTERIFDDSNVARILRGEQFIDAIPTRFRRAMLDKHITRLVKSDNGGPVFEPIRSAGEVIKLAARGGAFDLNKEFGISPERIAALDHVTSLAIAAGVDALRDAGIPLTMRYKTTSTGSQLPERWGLPDALRDDTGVIFASVFPGFDSFADYMASYYADRARRDQLVTLEDLRERTDGQSALRQELDRRIAELQETLAREPFQFDRRFLFRILSMGHSQFAELIGARGPNTQINAACASTTQAIAVAQDWIRAGRCRRVIVISADDITSDHLIEWFGAGFLASGAAATDDVVEEAAVPFDRRRHGMIMGMGAAALVLESANAAEERGLRPICEVLGAVAANSAFHGTRLDDGHIQQVMEQLVHQAETSCGIRREQIAPHTVFVSHETYTPARGGSASAEIHALRAVFGAAADQIVIANTKGFTGHAMGTGIEDVVAVKALETGCVPPVANFKEVDPELGRLNLSKGGAYPVDYALRLGAGFGSQISMTLLRRVGTAGARPRPNALGYNCRISDPTAWQNWLDRIAGHPAELEIAHRTLRVRDGGAPAKAEPVKETLVQAAAVPVLRPTPPPPVPAIPAPAPEPASDLVRQRIIELVVEKTGYPKDMLDLDLDLEADLGVDTVKQAEMFASIREIYNIPRDPNLKLRDFPTLARVIQFVYDHRPDLKAAPPVVVAVVTVETKAAPAEDAVRQKVLDLVVEKTGYPKDMLDLDLDLEADLGVDTVKQAEMFASIREIYNIPRDPNLKLRDFPTLARVIQFVYDHRPDLKAAPPEPAPAVAVVPALPAEDAVRQKILDLVVEKTGYPKDMLDLDLDLEADLGVDTVKQAEMFASIREIYNIPRDPNLKLRDFPTLARVIQFVYDHRPDLKAAPPVPAATIAAVPAPPAAEDSVQQKILDLVVEKTGYPKDMLDLNLDLEADLGVDTVKQAEMFASIREIYNIPRDPNLKLRDFPTLAHIIRFAEERRATATAPAIEERIEEPHHELATFEAADTIPRRVPIPALRPPLTVCKPTGITLEAGRRVFIMPDRNGVAEALADKLRALGVDVVLTTEMLDTTPTQGVYWLPALDDEGDLKNMTPAGWREAIDVRLKSFYRTMRTLYDQVAPSGTFLISATRLGGQHGYGETGATAPLGGAVTGFTKAYKRERPDALVKAVDFETARSAVDMADALINETLRDPGAVEIGYQSAHRWTVGLEERPVADGQPAMTLDKDSVFLITGAAGSIVSAITADLAAASGGTFHLLDLVPEPDAANPDIERFTTDKEGLKREFAARMQARGERPTPALVEKELAALERAHAAHAAIEAVRAAGGTAHYYSVNLTDGDAVAKVIEDIRQTSGRIDVLLHAAGIDRSHALKDKDQREFDLVFDVKSDGLFHLLHAIGEMPLGALIGFSSIAGRFGNGGQTDYSSANDLLCKIASNFRRTRPATRAIAIDWTAWGGIGMATRGSIPKVMEMAGIDMLPPAAGVPWVRRELTTGGGSGEVVVAGRLGLLLKDWDTTGGLVERSPNGPMLAKVRMDLNGCLTVETTLDPAVQPFLNDHRIEGTPVLPGVMGIEGFAEAAVSIAPGWRVEAVENIDFLAPFKFYRGEPRPVTIEGRFALQDNGLAADCRLVGRRVLANQADARMETHFTGRVCLTTQLRVPPAGLVFDKPHGSLIAAEDIYRVYFHGPAYRVLKRAWWDEKSAIGEMAADLPDNHHPGDQPLVIAPRLIELCFQTAGLFEMAVQHRMGLPRHVDRVSLYRPPDAASGPFFAVVTPDPATGTFNADVVDRAGTRYLNVSGYRTVVFREDIDAHMFPSAHVLMA